jgi:aminoglycoside phosphotransferase (APT) family kinase protein
VALPSGETLARQLFGRAPDRVRPLVERADHAAFRVSFGADEFVCKTDADEVRIAREAEGQQRGYNAGVPVPEVVALSDAALAMRFVESVPMPERRDDAAWRAAGGVLRSAHAIEPDGHWGEGLQLPRPTWRAHVEAEVEFALDECARLFGFDAPQAERIRAAVGASPALDDPIAAWCHGDCQPDHILIDPETNDVRAILDWSDHGKADAAWDLAVLTLDDAKRLDAVLDGYAPDSRQRAHLEAVIPLLRVTRWLGEACWLCEHGYPHQESLARASEWRA